MYRTLAPGFWQTMVTAANNKGENDRYMDHQVYLSQTHHIHEECGVFGVYAKKEQDLATLAYYGLYALQHRGQESAGIVVNDDGVFPAIGTWDWSMMYSAQNASLPWDMGKLW